MSGEESGLRVIAGPEHWNRVAAANRDAYGLSDARIREIIREEISWALQIARPQGVPAEPVTVPLTPAADKRQRRNDALIADYRGGLTIAQCAVKYQVGTSTVSNIVRLYGAFRRETTAASKIAAQRAERQQDQRLRDREIADAYASGLSALACAAKFGCTQSLVRAAVARSGGKMRSKGPAGRPARDDARTDVMAAMRNKGATLESIAAEFGITRERVRQVLTKAGVDTSDRPPTPEQKAIVEAYVAGEENLYAAAALAGMGAHAFKSLILRCGHVPRKHVRSNAVRADAIARQCAELRASGMKAKDIAREVGLNHAETVYRYLDRAKGLPEVTHSRGNPAASSPAVGLSPPSPTAGAREEWR